MVDGLKPTPESLSLIEKEKRGEITVSDIRETLNKTYRAKTHENLEQEFKYGTYNQNYSSYFPPIFTKLNSVQVQYCNSAKQILIRSADIVANKIYYLARTNNIDKLNEINNLFYIKQP